MTEYLFARLTDVDVETVQELVDDAEAAAAAALVSQNAAAASETAAGNAQTAAEAAQLAAEQAAQDAENAADNFDDVYLGSKAADPTLDNDGNALVEGQLYWNSVANNLRVYDGAAWNAYSATSGITSIVDDTTPQLGGHLDPNSFGVSAAWTPSSNDGAALGSTTLMWSDLFLASGGVLNWNNGDVTLTHSANALAFAGASSGYSFDASISIISGSPQLVLTDSDTGADSSINASSAAGSLFINADINNEAANSTMVFGVDGANIAQFEAGIFRPTTGADIQLGSTTQGWGDLFLTTGGVVNWASGDITITHSANALAFAGGTFTFAGGAVTPAANDGAALGTTALMWSDLFLASGAVVNFNNGDVTITHSSNLLTVAGGDLLVPNLELGNADTTLARESAGWLAVEGNVQARRTPVASAFSADFTLALTDAGAIRWNDSTVSETVTIPTNTSIPFPVGTVINLINRASGSITVADGDTGVTVNGVSGGTVTCSTRWQGLTLLKVATDEWIVSGAIDP